MPSDYRAALLNIFRVYPPLNLMALSGWGHNLCCYSVILGSQPNSESPWVVLQDLSSWVIAMTRDASLLSGGKEVILCGPVETVWGFFGSTLQFSNKKWAFILHPYWFSRVACAFINSSVWVSRSVTVSVTEKYHSGAPSVMVNLNCLVAKRPPLLQPLH